MSAFASPHAFRTVRRGYQPTQVEERLASLTADRDAARERLSRLSGLAQQMEARLQELRRQAETIGPAEFQVLGQRAQAMLLYVEEEAGGLREEAEEIAEAVRSKAERGARAVREVAQREAMSKRRAAEEEAARILAEARGRAEALRSEAVDEAARTRSGSEHMIDSVRQRVQQIVTELERSHEKRLAETDVELSGHESEVNSRLTGLLQRAENMLADAQRSHAEAFEAGRRSDVRTRARADELLARAALEAERIEREVDREVREHERSREAIRRHLSHVRRTLAVATGGPVTEDYEESQGQESQGQEYQAYQPQPRVRQTAQANVQQTARMRG